MLLKKEENVISVFCDGGARGNPGPAAAACIISDPAEKKRYLCGKYLGVATNNQAEYNAVYLALKTIKENCSKRGQVKFYLDSKLAASQLAGVYKVKDPSLQKLVFKIRVLESSLGEVYYQYISRQENREADSLVNKVLEERKDFFEILTS